MTKKKAQKRSKGKVGTIQLIPLSKLKPFDRNPRLNDSAVDAVAESIKIFGFNNPILIRPDKTILAGHTRLKAAHQLGLTEAPCIVLSHLSDTEAKAYNIADNRTGEIAEWDNVQLGELLAELKDEDALDGIGFDEDSLNALIAEAEAAGLEPQADEDEVPDVPRETITQTGDIILLGKHRLMCGDSTKVEDVEALMDGKKADMVFTDPPYGNAEHGKYGRGQLGVRTIHGDEDFTTFATCISQQLSPTYVFFLQWRTFQDAFFALESHQYAIKTVAVWDKKQAGLSGAGGISEQWEAIIIAGKPEFIKFGGNVFTISREHKLREDSPHPHQKPVELLVELLDYFPLGMMIDPFLGSGSTLIACEKTGRTCYGMEIDPNYTQVCIERWENYTGKEAILASTGQTFSEVKASGRRANKKAKRPKGRKRTK